MFDNIESFYEKKFIFFNNETGSFSKLSSKVVLLFFIKNIVTLLQPKPYDKLAAKLRISPSSKLLDYARRNDIIRDAYERCIESAGVRNFNDFLQKTASCKNLRAIVKLGSIYYINGEKLVAVAGKEFLRSFLEDNILEVLKASKYKILSKKLYIDAYRLRRILHKSFVLRGVVNEIIKPSKVESYAVFLKKLKFCKKIKYIAKRESMFYVKDGEKPKIILSIGRAFVNRLISENYSSITSDPKGELSSMLHIKFDILAEFMSHSDEFVKLFRVEPLLNRRSLWSKFRYIAKVNDFDVFEKRIQPYKDQNKKLSTVIKNNTIHYMDGLKIVAAIDRDFVTNFLMKHVVLTLLPKKFKELSKMLYLNFFDFRRFLRGSRASLVVKNNVISSSSVKTYEELIQRLEPYKKATNEANHNQNDFLKINTYVKLEQWLEAYKEITCVTKHRRIFYLHNDTVVASIDVLFILNEVIKSRLDLLLKRNSSIMLSAMLRIHSSAFLTSFMEHNAVFDRTYEMYIKPKEPTSYKDFLSKVESKKDIETCVRRRKIYYLSKNELITCIDMKFISLHLPRNFMASLKKLQEKLFVDKMCNVKNFIFRNKSSMNILRRLSTPESLLLEIKNNESF